MRFAKLLAAALLLSACRNNDAPAANDLLAGPPYAPLTDSIRAAPRNAGLYYRRGQLLYVNDQPEAARADLRRAWSLQPREDIALSLTTALRRASEDSALLFLREARKQLPQSLALAVSLARAYQKKGEIDAALELCNNILAQVPNQLDALLLKSELLDGAGRAAESLQALESAYALAPSDVDIAHRLGFAYGLEGNPKTLTLTDSLIALDRDGVHAEPYYFKGLYFEKKGKPSEAIRWLDEAIRHDYNFLDAHMEKGQLQYEAKSYDAALLTFQRALTITPTFADGYYWVGKCLEAKGNLADARTNYQRALGLDKGNAEFKAAAERL